MNHTKINSTRLACLSLLSVTVGVAISGCQTGNTGATDTNNPIEVISNDSNSHLKTSETISEQAVRIQTLLANGEFDKIADDIHPTKGVRFSMYAYVNPKTDKVFSKADYLQYLQQSRIRFTWGEMDGSGEPLVIPLPQYLAESVQAEDFNTGQNATIKISINQSYGSGNSRDNLTSVYPRSSHEFVEFYFAGTQQYQGIDWRALRLVFENYQGKRYLVAMITDQWTI